LKSSLGTCSDGTDLGLDTTVGAFLDYRLVSAFRAVVDEGQTLPVSYFESESIKDF